MKIIIKGTKREIAIAKDVLSKNCIFDNEYCERHVIERCEECEKKHNLKIEYKVEEK